MPDTELDDIIAANPLDGTERVYIVQDITGTPHDRKTTTQDIADLASATPAGVNGDIQTNNSGSFGALTPGAGVATFLATPSSANLAAAVTDETGTGAIVFANTPTLVTPVLGVATATSINKVALTAPATGSTLTIADGKTLTASNTLTFTGTDSSSVAFGAGGTVAYTSNKLSAFAATTSAELAGVISDETGTGALVFANSPTFTDDITLGTQQTTQGAIILANTAAGAFATTIKSSNSASAAWTLTLPTTAGTNNYVLKTDGSGNTSWVAQSGGGGSPGGNSGQYQYNNSGSFGGIGQILFADTTFYVRTDGNNANNGLANTSGGAWLTIQYAVDYMATVDANGYGVTIQVGDGTYAAASPGGFCVSIIYRPRNAKYYYILGNTTTPANVVIDGSDQSPWGFLIGNNYDTGANAMVIIDSLAGFELKNAYSFTTVFNSSIVSYSDCISRDNVNGFELYDNSSIGISDFLYAGLHSYLALCEWGGGCNGSTNIDFEAGSTFDAIAFYIGDYSVFAAGNFDFTNLSAVGGATKYSIFPFGYLFTIGNYVNIPGAAGTLDALGYLD